MTPLLAIQLVLQYGPTILTEVEGLFSQQTVTAAQVQAIFAGLKPYSAFGVTPPVVALPPTPPSVIKSN